MGAEERGDGVGDIFIERKPQARHALREGGGVGCEQGVDRRPMLVVVEQRRLHRLPRDGIRDGGVHNRFVGNGSEIRRSPKPSM